MEDLEDLASGLAQARLAAIVESSDDAIISKTLEGVITSWNRSAERIFGFTAEEAIGQHVHLIIPPERHAEEAEVLARLGRGERIDHFETQRRTKDGRLLDISLTVSPVRDRTGRIVGASKVARDVTERRRAERDREQLVASLDAARAEAVAANRAKDEFLAVLSHELRSPMNAMLGWLRVLKTSGTRDSRLVERAVETLERNLWVQAEVINDLLDVSRILSGKLDIDQARLDLAALLSGCVESLRPSAESKGIALTLHIGCDSEILGDAGRIQQIFANLIGNAIKFTERGGSVDVAIRTTGDSSVQVVVEDTGIGIEPDFLPHLFERFRQADARSSVRKHGGLGLGLSIVDHLVTLHGGSIEAESEGVGRGARFTVILPVAEARPRAAFAREGPRPKVSTSSSFDVLLVEDDDDTRAAMELALLEFGHRVRSVSSVRAALDEYNARAPEVLISDIGMPGADGYSLIRAIRDVEDGRTHRTLAIAMTGFAGKEDHAMALRAGFDAHLAKPIEPEVLIERIMVLAASREPEAWQT